MKDIVVIPDPRPDLSFDTVEWRQLLSLLQHMDKQVAGILHGFRCGGLRLHRGGRGYELQPDIDPNQMMAVWANEAEYWRDRERWLVPHGKTIIKALSMLNKYYERVIQSGQKPKVSH